MELKGLEVAGLRRRRIWVRAQRKPLKKAAEMTRRKPGRLKETSPATIITTPRVMVAMMAVRRQVGDSRRKRKAKRRTKAREEDLHIAKDTVSWVTGGVGEKGRGLTVEGEGDELQRGVP